MTSYNYTHASGPKLSYPSMRWSPNQMRLQQQMISLKTLGKRILARFGDAKKPVKGLKGYFRAQKIEQKDEGGEMTEEERRTIGNSHNILYAQFAPTFFLMLPAVFLLNMPVDPSFLQICNVLQYYTSGLLCFNLFFNEENKAKWVPFLGGVGLVNLISGPVSIVSPALLGLVNFYFPFSDESMLKAQNEQQAQNYTVYMRVQAIFYFIIVVLTTLKVYHFLMVKQMQKKIKGLEDQNRMHFQTKSRFKQ